MCEQPSTPQGSKAQTPSTLSSTPWREAPKISAPNLGVGNYNATALPLTRSASRHLESARRHGLGPNMEPRARQAPSLLPRAATQRSDLGQSYACAQPPTPSRQPSTSPQQSSSFRPETNGAAARHCAKSQLASTQ